MPPQDECSNTLCCLAMPADMSVSQFCAFCGAYLEVVREMRVLRREAASKAVSMLLMKFAEQQQAKDFLTHNNGKPVRCSSF